VSVKGSITDGTEIVKWNLRPFGGVRVGKVDIPGRGVIFGAHINGAMKEDGSSLIGYGATEIEAIQELWRALTGTKGSGIIFAGRLYEWTAGIFQEIFR